MTTTAERLRLRAADAEDLAVIAACLQDARIPLREMAYVAAERRFLAAFTRYRRELLADPRSCAGLTETAAAIVFEEIEAVRYRGIDTAQRDRELTLLTIATAPGRERLVHIELIFEGDARIQLQTDRIRVRMEDFGEPRLSATTPCDHEACELPGWLESYDYKG
jgi:hypothetical protein